MLSISADSLETLKSWLEHAATLRWVLTVIAGVALAALFNKLVSIIIPRLVRFVADRADNTDDTEKLIKWRRLETFLSAVLAFGKVLLFFVALYIAWRLVNPQSAPVALVGASALFIVVMGATVGPLLRDLTYGIIMIAERWYNVGDHILVEPFANLGGVVEQVTLRSTKLRSLNGEIIWLHNQHIQGVRITPRGAKTLAVDVFVADLAAGKRLLTEAMSTVPTGPTMVVRKFKIVETEQMAESLWRITAVGQIAAGREWLIEDFAITAIKKHDRTHNEEEIIVHGPIARFADDAAERRFKRSVRAKN